MLFRSVTNRRQASLSNTSRRSKDRRGNLAMRDAPRFEFGKNWSSFARNVDERHVVEAQRSLERLLGVSSLTGKRFLDIGCGSGLFTVAASRMGAHVVSFDFDPRSVATTQRLAERFKTPVQSVCRGDVLDDGFLAKLKQYDVVYAWGVLHHTGRMWDAIENAAGLVAPGGVLAIAIYNDQGRISKAWRAVKRAYVALPRPMRPLLVTGIVVPYEAILLFRDVFRLRPQDSMARWTAYKSKRGMSRIHDHVDWIGGYPFEVATPERITSFVELLGLSHQRTIRNRGRRNNEFVFRRPAESLGGAS
jgi:2-polyprenyl-3-methyl-5-hydroxy-6-metoxy-1,4-benzoquinol methylase